VFALMAVQWWIHVRRLGAIERGIGAVATSVGEGIINEHFQVFVGRIVDDGDAHGMVWVGDDGRFEEPTAHGTVHGDLEIDTRVVELDDPMQQQPRTVKRYIRRPDGTIDVGDPSSQTVDGIGVATVCYEENIDAEIQSMTSPGPNMSNIRIQHFGVHLDTAEETEERVLVVVNEGGDEHRIPIPISPTVEVLHGTTRSGIAMSAGLLVLALAGSGVLASRLTRPLRRLAESAEALGRGDLGVQVPETAGGEVGDLQRAFNGMSQRLAELEEERELWRRREHLAQLGDLSRGLAHTVRNPLNTLGLAVDELASEDVGRDHLVVTARAQIRRIDRWLRSFLALGAGDAAEPIKDDLCGLAQGVVLEAIQEGAEIEVEIVDEHLPVLSVPTAIRAALANLIQNASEASPQGESVEIVIRREGYDGVVTIADRGSGLTDEVRERLYKPHVTTKLGGSGMGLFLAQQLVVDMNGGALEVRDREGGGTMATVRLPLVADDGGDNGNCSE